jgi:ABC-2 type transport system ATP-binding protein
MKAALLSSLAYRPKLLVLDEPFSGLDPLVRDEFIQGVLEVSEIGDWTVFISSHDINEVEMLCDWTGILTGGRLQLTEHVESLQARFRRIEVVSDTTVASSVVVPEHWLCYEQSGTILRFIETNFVAGKTEALCRERFPSAAVTAHPMTLREIFVALMRAGRPQSREGALL